MNDNLDLDQWEALFRDELGGKDPMDKALNSVPPIQMGPYVPIQLGDFKPYPGRAKDLSYWFWLNDVSWNWFSEKVRELTEYPITGFFLDNDLDISPQILLRPLRYKDDEEIFIRDTSDILRIDLGLLNAIDEAKKGMEFLRSYPNGSLVFVAGHDFIRNVSLIRGLFKAIGDNMPARDDRSRFYGMIDLNTLVSQQDESMLIPSTNQILALLVCGVADFIWDVRIASPWTQSHLNYLLNIPEILFREGKVLLPKDPFQGSSFFETLSDRIARHISI
ncbi:MAG TPA: hypothetical protein VKZ56_04385 [Membranihabitans sp.]|nr:hypothetical protein [Membranihabitans sp.]